MSEQQITDTQATAATETGSEAMAGNESNQAETRTFTQDDVDRIVQNRLKQVEKKFEGVDINEYQTLKQQQAEAEKQSMMKREQFQELLQKQKSEYESRIQEMSSELQRVHVDGALLNAASKNRAVNPEHVASLLKSQVKLGEGNQVEVLDKDGNVRYNTETALPMTVEEAVLEFLAQNPYARAAAPAGGGSNGNATQSASREVKLSDLNMRDPEHRKLYKEKFALGNQRSFAKK